MKIKLRVDWCESRQAWMLKDIKRQDMFIYDLFDCGTVRFLFPGLDKTKSNIYTMEVQKGE